MSAVEIPTVTDGAWIDRVADATGDDAGPTLREWRRSTKTSQIEAARRLGMTQQNLSQIETGRHPMSYELRRRAVTSAPSVIVVVVHLQTGPRRQPSLLRLLCLAERAAARGMWRRLSSTCARRGDSSTSDPTPPPRQR